MRGSLETGTTFGDILTINYWVDFGSDCSDFIHILLKFELLGSLTLLEVSQKFLSHLLLDEILQSLNFSLFLLFSKCILSVINKEFLFLSIFGALSHL